MGRVNTPILSTEAKKELVEGFKTGKSHAFRIRCHLVLLKAEQRKSKEVAKIVNMCEMSVNNWLLRYKIEGIEGLKTKKGRGRKPLLKREEDSLAVLEAIKTKRQRLQSAKAEFEANTGKKVSRDTLRRFLKVLAEDISE